LKDCKAVTIFNNMNPLFVPYAKSRPAALSIKGHKVIIVSKDKGSLEDNLNLVGADRVRKLRSGHTEEAQDYAMERLARSINGGVVVAPGDLDVGDVIKNLEDQLPWLQ